MRTRAAVLHGPRQQWKVEEVEIDPPREHEVLVRSAYAGLCHSDEHIRSGDFVAPPEALSLAGAESMFPIIGGHEGSGLVTQVGPGVTSVAVGDQVGVSFVPSCGRCHSCVSGRQNLCDRGVLTLAGPMLSDQTWRHHLAGHNLHRMAQLGTFAEHLVVHEDSLVRVEPDVSLRAVTLVSCGVTTGFGSAANRGRVRPGETVVVVGCGGVGVGAIQGARVCGAATIVAVDPVELKRERSFEFGATHSVSSIEEALPLVANLTCGRMAEVVILTPGLLTGDILGPALNLTSKDGRLVCTAASPADQVDVKVSLLELTMFNKAILGSLFGSGNPRIMIPRLLDLYRKGVVKLDEMVTREYTLDEINDGYDDLAAGRNIRGVIRFT